MHNLDVFTKEVHKNGLRPGSLFYILNNLQGFEHGYTIMGVFILGVVIFETGFT